MKRCVLCLLIILWLIIPASATEAGTGTAIAKLSAENASLTFFDEVKYGNYATPKTDSIDGAGVWVMDKSDKNGYFIGFDLSAEFASKIADGSEFEIEIDYYSTGNGFFHLVYDARERAERICDMVSVGNSNKFKTAAFTTDDGYFDNRVYGKYDFALTIESPRYYGSGISGASVSIKEVRVKRHTAKNKITHRGYTKETGNVFPVWGEKFLYNEFTNTTDEKLNAVVTYKAVGTDGETHWTKTETISLEAGEKKEYRVSADIARCDLYTLQVDVENIEKKIDSSYNRYNFAVVRTDPWGIKNENYYLAAHFQHYGDNTDDGLDVIAKSNTYGVRTEFGWTHVYDSSNRKNNIYTDEDKAFHQKLRENDLHLLAVYGFSVAKETGGWKYLPTTSGALASWSQGIEFVVKNTTDLIERIEIWNEPDVLDFNGGSDYTGDVNEFGVKSSPEQYAEAAKRAYTSAKKGNPDVKVGVMSLVGLRNTTGVDFFKRAMVNAGLQDYADAVTMHPYSDGSAEHYHNMGDYEKAYMNTLTTDKELEFWNTEYGFSTTDNASNTELKQARNMVRTPIHLMGEGVGDVNVGYNFARKGLNPSNREDNFGIVGPGFEGGDSEFDKNFVPRQAYVAVSAMNYYMAQAESDGMGNYGDAVLEDARNEHDSEHIYRFISHKFNGDVYVMWRTEKEVEKELDMGAESVILADMYGNEQMLRSDDGKYTFKIGFSPCFVIVKNEQTKEFRVDDIAYMRKENGNWVEATALEDNKDTVVRVTGYNPADADTAVDVILAYYSENTLTKAEVVRVPVSAEGLLCYEQKLDRNKYSAIKCVAWNMDKMMPYTECKTIE